MDTKKFQVGGEEVVFSRIGFRLRTKAAEELRTQREKAFARMLTQLPSGDPLTAATSASAAVEQYLAGALITDTDIQRWIILTPEGQEFVLRASLMRVDGDLTEERFEDIMDGLDYDNLGDIIRYAASGVVSVRKVDEDPEDKSNEDDADGPADGEDGLPGGSAEDPVDQPPDPPAKSRKAKKAVK
jgi:hypothetical protein